MPNARDQMKTIEAELERVRKQLADLQLEEAVLLRLRAKMLGQPESLPQEPRKRATNVKPMILEIMHNAGLEGMTSADVANVVKSRQAEVGKDTVGSVLSRLKSDGALVYAGDRYYEKQFRPQPNAPAASGWPSLN